MKTTAIITKLSIITLLLSATVTAEAYELKNVMTNPGLEIKADFSAAKLTNPKRSLRFTSNKNQKMTRQAGYTPSIDMQLNRRSHFTEVPFYRHSNFFMPGRIINENPLIEQNLTRYEGGFDISSCDFTEVVESLDVYITYHNQLSCPENVVVDFLEVEMGGRLFRFDAEPSRGNTGQGTCTYIANIAGDELNEVYEAFDAAGINNGLNQESAHMILSAGRDWVSVNYPRAQAYMKLYEYGNEQHGDIYSMMFERALEDQNIQLTDEQARALYLDSAACLVSSASTKTRE